MKARQKIMRSKGLIIGLFVLGLSCLMFIGTTHVDPHAANALEISPSAQLYELPDTIDYDIEGQPEVNSFAYGKSALGKFTIDGNIDDIGKYRNRTAYAASGNLSFSYSYDGWLQGQSIENWNICSDTATSVAGYKLTGSVGQGAVLVQTSADGSVYVDAANPVTDFFSEKIGRNNFYTTEGSAVARGSFYRIIVAYETRQKTGTTGWWPFQKDVFEYKRNVEIYEFYVCRNDPIISLHDLSVDDQLLEKAMGYTSEASKHGETLISGATTTTGFSIDKLGSNDLVYVARNGETPILAEDKANFTENGKYSITTKTKLGKENTQTVYVFNGGEDKGFSTYFDKYIVKGSRVYRDKPHPVYAKNSSAHLNATEESIPFLTGTLTNNTTGETFSFSQTRRAQDIPLTVGEYSGVFYSGDPDLNSGSLYKYTFVFEIINEDSGPYVNYNNLINTQNLEDLGAKHYEVAYQMTRGGYIFVCFSLDSYREAFSYAYDIEGRFVEKVADGWYYKSETNPNHMIKYYDSIELTRVRNLYAAQNVEYNYFNAKDEYTYRTLENVEELEGLNLAKSIKVFASAEEKQKLTKRQPFINNFMFIQAADFDVVSVEAFCYKNGQTYHLDFDKAVSDQLHVSSKYKITERNIYGDERVYDVYFLLENLTESTWEYSYNGETKEFSLSSNNLENGVKTVVADSIEVKSIGNSFDTDSIVTIKAPDVYSFEIKCLLSELKDIELYKQGQYEITFIDRLGNSYKLLVEITGKTRYSALKEKNRCYTDFYNSVYMNQKSDSEEVIVDIEGLKNLIEKKFDQNKFTASSYNVYKARLQEAMDVYNDPNATQGEINEAAKNLQSAIDGLVVSADKTALRAELDLYESLDKERYTSESFQRYTESYIAAARIYADDTVSNDDVSQAVLDLQHKYAALVLRGDKTDLTSVLNAAKKIDCLKYTPSSVEALDAAFDIAYEVYMNKDASQNSIDQVIALVNEKIHALVLQANFDLLGETIQQVKQVDPKLYNRASIQNLKEKYDFACKVFNDRNSTQSEVNLALTDLQIAYSGLSEIGDIEGLYGIMQEIKDLKWFLYVAEGINSLKAEYDSAIELLNDDFVCSDDIGSMILSLTTLKDKLFQRADKVELYEYLAHFDTVDLSDNNAEAVNAFREAYERAYKTLYDLDADEESVAKSISELQAAENGLKVAERPWWESLMSFKVKGLPLWEILIMALSILVLTVIAAIIIKVVFDAGGVAIALCILLAIAAAVTALVCLLIYCSWLNWWILLICDGALAVTVIAEILIGYLIEEVL